jgi:NAD(P)-dependent dehydrogenase (short-subunit alcohol dehydrogenase family)
MLLQDTVALITGAGRGIGRAIALAFAAEGADLVLCARTGAQVQAVREQVRGRGRRCLALAADVGRAEDIERVVAEAMRELGRIDILVNNAGISRDKPFVDTSLADWHDTFAVNLYGVVHCLRAVLPGMLTRGSGSIINIASGAGQRGLPGNSAYSAAKAGVIALSQALADEVGKQGVRVNAIAPGPIKTEMLDASPLQGFLLKGGVKLLPPDDVAGAALFLASSLSGGMSGQVLTIRNTNRW